MNSLGAIIRELREEKNITRKQLTEGICTEKYLYLIERGDRNPSAEIVRAFSQRLKTDLYQYYHYSDCQDPIKVASIVEGLNQARGLAEYEERFELAREAEKLPDFKTKPWCYILEGIKAEYKLVVENKIQETIGMLEKLIGEMSDELARSEFATVLFLIYAYALELDQQYEKAYATVLKIEEIQEKKREYYNPVALNVVIETGVISVISSYRMKKYQEARDKARELRLLMREHALFTKGTWLFVFYAYSCFYLGERDEALYNFKKALTMQMLTQKKTDLEYIIKDSDFSLLMDEFKDDYIVKAFVGYCRVAL